MNQRKWPDNEHWQFPMHHLGDDEYGSWFHVPKDSIVRRGSAPARPMGDSLVVLVPDNVWWLAEFSWDNPHHTVYVNIGTPCQRDGDRITQIDLDLDVIRKLNGEVEILDEDEFARHQVLYNYPDDLVTGARSAAEDVAQLVTACAEPFGTASVPWIELARFS
jgi:hypothetical protein